MTLPPGERLGPYEIVSQLGAGGMGEVYRAMDTRLHRTVAIKVVSSAETSRPEFAARFEREARAISSFSHPHICTVYDFGKQGQLHYLVMEYLEGETLAERLRRGPLKLDEFIRYSLQIAEALVQAHRQGHLHRDIKPANVMLTKSGAKLLDFGLARSIHVVGGQNDETRTRALTADGAIVGTYPYMSPEQLQGREVDVRSDIFSFGAVLYEMATGERAFDGGSTASVIAAVLDREPPPVSTLRPELSASLEWIIHTCLRKDPDERWQTVHDLKLEFGRLREAQSSSAASAAAAPAGRGFGRDAAIALGACAVTVALMLVASRLNSPEALSRQAIRFEITAPERSSFSIAGSASVPVIAAAVSPDGSKIAFVAERDGSGLLWVRDINEPVPRPLPGTEAAQQPFWSPDSRWIGFFAENELKKIDLSGGPVVTLCDVSVDPRGGAWLRSNTIVFATNQRDGLMRIPASGGSPQPVYPPTDASYRYWPSPLPDGNHFIFLDRRKRAAFIGSVDSASPEFLVKTDWAAVYVDPGYLLYLNNGVLIAQEFEAKSRSLSGEPVHLIANVGAANNSMPGFSASQTGMLVYSPLLIDRTEIVLLNRKGGGRTQIAEPAFYTDVSLSPDEQMIAFSRVDPARAAQDIWIHTLSRGTTTRFTSEPLIEAGALWSGDGKNILYRCNRTGVINLYIRALNGGPDRAIFEREDQLTAHGGARNVVPNSWSRDGEVLLYTAPGRQGYDLFRVSMTGPRAPQPVARSPFNDMHGALSPDGRWVAFASDETGRLEVYVQRFPDGTGKQQISSSGGWEPKWRGDGRELYFLSASGKLMVLGFGATGAVDRPQQLMTVPTPRPSPFKTAYTVSADGQKFFFNTLAHQDRPVVITAVVNWSALLKR